MTKVTKVVELLPKFIRILHSTYKIDTSNELAMAAKGRLGEIMFDDRVISMTEQSPSDVVDTLIHEMLHGLCNAFAMDMKIDLEERVVTSLATGLVTIMMDNPDLFPTLQAIVDFDRDKFNKVEQGSKNN